MNTTDLKEKRIYSRLLEMATPIIFNGENHRIKTMREKAMTANLILMESRWYIDQWRSYKASNCSKEKSTSSNGKRSNKTDENDT